jgi:hypothetical protein
MVVILKNHMALSLLGSSRRLHFKLYATTVVDQLSRPLGLL